MPVAKVLRTVLDTCGPGCALIAALLPNLLVAETLTVAVVDSTGAPVPEVVIYAGRGASGPTVPQSEMTAVMDQVDRRFVPHILVVQTGTAVDFPNSDDIAHHVYSFSHPNHFKLPMYKGRAHPPVTFTESGIVVLGCNIHDNMLGYIVVVDTPTFGVTDDAGTVVLSAPGIEAGNVEIWSPRIRDDLTRLVAEVRSSNQGTVATFRLAKPLYPAYDGQSEALSWSEY